MDALGDETAVAFSVNFDPTELAYVAIAPGADVPGAQIIPNANLVTAGQLGIAISLPPGNALQMGSMELLKIRFGVPPSAEGNSHISFMDQPVWRETSDSVANPLPTEYQAMSMDILPLRPMLSLGTGGDQVTISWPSAYEGFHLEMNTNSVAESLGWIAVDISPEDLEGIHRVTLPKTSYDVYYRLHRP
jgi:hypothetical protein